MENCPNECPICFAKNSFKWRHADEIRMTDLYICSHDRIIDGKKVVCGFPVHIERHPRDLPPPDYDSNEAWSK